MAWTLTQGNAETWLAALEPDSVEGMVTDPPYASGGMSASARRATSANTKYVSDAGAYPEFLGDSRDQRSWTQWCAWWLMLAHRAIVPGGVVVVFADWRQAPALSDALQMAGFQWRGVMVWDKTGAARPVLGRPTNQCEFLPWGSKGALASDRRCNTDSGIMPGCYRHRVDAMRDKYHTTGKPTALMLDIVRLVAEGGTIIDPFAGSGTTGVAAVRLGYDFHGCELSPEYAEIARARLTDAAADFRAPGAHQLALGEWRE